MCSLIKHVSECLWAQKIVFAKFKGIYFYLRSVTITKHSSALVMSLFTNPVRRFPLCDNSYKTPPPHPLNLLHIQIPTKCVHSFGK